MNLANEKKRLDKLSKEGFAKFVARDYESAFRVFEQILARDDQDPMANTVGAACLLSLGRVDEAESLGRAGVQIAPQLSLAHYSLGLVLIAKENYEEAESEIWDA